VSFILLFAGMAHVDAQVEFPGKAVGLESHLKAADLMYVLPPVDPLELAAALQENSQSGLKSFHFALERSLDLNPESHGFWDRQGDQRIWRIHVLSPEAVSLGLVFHTFRLEPGVKVFVYDPDMKRIKGAFTSGNNKSSGILSVGHVPGQEVVVEMQVPAGVEDYGILRMESLSHAYKEAGQYGGSTDCPAGEFGCSQACELDINCREGEDWQLTKQSVVRIYTTRQYCSGVLINNSSYDGTPYVLTAEHCLNRQYYAERSVFQFNYESPSCFGPDGPLDMSISGADLLASGDSVDFCLLELSLLPPDSFKVYYAGWDRSDFQTTPSKTIHHPWGDVKKITSDYEAPSEPKQPGDVPYTDLDDYHYFSYWWIRGWDEGSTEGGSSGGPLFNSDQKVIGNLSGGIAKCGDSIGYDYEKNRVIYNQAFNYDDYYTKLSMSWDFEEEKGNVLKTWLDPGNSGVMVLGGYNPVGVFPEQINPGSQFKLFPNPVVDELHLVNPGMQGPFDYRMYSLSGALVRSGTLEGSAESIPTATLPGGLYVIRVSQAGFSEYLKFVRAR